MNKKIFLTSIFAIAFACPAFAVDGNATIENGDTCNVDNLGTSTNNDTANIEAIWTPNTYSEPAGQYLLFENVTISQHQTCPANYYCQGFTDETFADTSIGLSSCSETGRNLSDPGATNPQLCYNNGSSTCANFNPVYVENGSVSYANQSVTYKEYFDIVRIPNDTLACAATITCNNGYTASEKGPLADYVNLQVLEYDNNYQRSKSNSGTITHGNNANELSNGSWEIIYNNGTKVQGISSCNTTNNELWSYLNTNVSKLNNGQMSPETFMTGVAQRGTQEQTERIYELLTQYSSGDLTADQVTMITAKEFAVDTSANFTQNSSGQYCWCKMTGYQLSGTNNVVNTSSNSYWGYIGVIDPDYDATTCGNYCAHECASWTAYWNWFSAAIFGEYGEYPTCDTNQINLDWYDDTVANNGQKIIPNNDAANQCSYSGTITVPTNTMEKTGYTFGGWKLRTNTTPEK